MPPHLWNGSIFACTVALLALELRALCYSALWWSFMLLVLILSLPCASHVCAFILCSCIRVSSALYLTHITVSSRASRPVPLISCAVLLNNIPLHRLLSSDGCGVSDTPFGLVASVPPSARDSLPTSTPAPVAEAQHETAGGGTVGSTRSVISHLNIAPSIRSSLH